MSNGWSMTSMFNELVIELEALRERTLAGLDTATDGYDRLSIFSEASGIEQAVAVVRKYALAYEEIARGIQSET